MRRTFSYFVLTIVAALTFAACGSNFDSSSTASSAKFNDADVMFTQSMILHHQQAVEMAKMAQKHASTTEVKQLADEIEAAQGPEITTMTGWLKDWGKKAPKDSMSGMDHGTMTGMMSDDDMKKLSAATGPAFDKMFLTKMISHHSGAIEMAKSEQKDGRNKDAVALAKKIEAAQTTEMADMKKLLIA